VTLNQDEYDGPGRSDLDVSLIVKALRSYTHKATSTALIFSLPC